MICIYDTNDTNGKERDILKEREGERELERRILLNFDKNFCHVMLAYLRSTGNTLH